MRLFLCFFSLAVAGGFLIVAPAEWVKLSHLPGMAGLYYQSLSAFSIPLCLLILKLFRMPFVGPLSFMWSVWLTSLGMWILWDSAELLSGAGLYGLLFVAFVFIITLATAMLTGASLGKKRQAPPNT